MEIYLDSFRPITAAQVYNTLMNVNGFRVIALVSDMEIGKAFLKPIFEDYPCFVEAGARSKREHEWRIEYKNRSSLYLLPKDKERLCGTRADVVLLDEINPDDINTIVRPILSTCGIELNGHLKPYGIYRMKL